MSSYYTSYNTSKKSTKSPGINKMVMHPYALVVDGINGRAGDITLSLEATNTPAQLSKGSVRLNANGELQFQIAGSEGQNYLVEQSADLVRWEGSRFGTLVTGTEAFTVPLRPDGGSRFYRVIPQP